MTTANVNVAQQTVAQKPAQDIERVLDKKTMEYVPFGGSERLKLTVRIIRDLIAVPTKRNFKPTDEDCIRFMMMCQARLLNPFEGDAFMVGYDTQDGPKFSLITAHQAFLKRAEVHPEYDGMESGVIIHDDAAGSLIEREGDFHLKNETVVGGWARVFFKHRSHPTTRKIRMERFNKGFAQWTVDPAGMIVKCAEADALRSSFPTMVGGLYLREELDFLPGGKPEMLKPMFEVGALSDTAGTTAATPDNSLSAESQPASPAAEPEQPAGLKALRDLARIGKIKEGEILDSWAKEGATDGSAASLEEVQLKQPDLVEQTAKRFAEFADKVKAARKAG